MLYSFIKSKEYYRVLLFRTVGNFLVLASLFMIGKTFYQPFREEIRYYINTSIGTKFVISDDRSATSSTEKKETVAKGGLARLLNLKQVEVLTPVDPSFSIVIPKIAANSRVISNVDPGNEEIYKEALKKGVAHADGTMLPGQGGHVYLFAHSTTDNLIDVGTYNAVFYLLYKLETGDEIDVFYNNQRHIYKVTEKKIIEPTEVQYLTRQTETEFLTLQTCYPPGTRWKRLIVFAEPVVKE